MASETDLLLQQSSKTFLKSVLEMVTTELPFLLATGLCTCRYKFIMLIEICHEKNGFLHKNYCNWANHRMKNGNWEKLKPI